MFSSLTYARQQLSEMLLWEQSEVKPVEKEKLKLQLMNCQLLAATKLYRTEVPRPVNLTARYIEQTCFQYLGDDSARETSSGSFVLNSYPRGFYSM